MCNNACQYKFLFTPQAMPCHHSLYWFVATFLVPWCPSNGYSIKQHLVDNEVYVIQSEIKSVLYCSYWTWMSSGHFVAVIGGVNEAWGILLLASKSLCNDAFRTLKKMQHVGKCIYVAYMIYSDLGWSQYAPVESLIYILMSKHNRFVSIKS